MDEAAASNARVKTFFERDPIEFIDDVVAAMSHYVESGIESLGSIMADVRLSDNHKRAFLRELMARVMHSLNVNSDIFEMYVMRNIFHIPVDVDLAGSLMPGPGPDAEDLDRSFGRDADSDDLDEEMRALIAQIEAGKDRRRRLAQSIRASEARLKVSQAALNRMPAIAELAHAAAAVPAGRVDELIRSMSALLQRAEAAEAPASGASLAFHQSAFNFD
jgi:hypothetical protein